MLNYNYNWIEPLQKQRQFLLGKADWQWSLSTYVASGVFRSPLLVFGTGSIQYVPFAPTTLFASSSFETGSLYSGSAAGLPVDIAITSSGQWPLTGSNTLSIVIGSNVGFNQSKILTLSQAAGNMNLSGSKISSSFYPSTNQQYNINFGIQHTKGNIYNPLINWSAVKTSPLGNTISVNGEVSASFNIVKNTTASDTQGFTNTVFIKEVSGSAQSSSFNNDYSYSVTASYTASINSVTGSTTMSFVCAEEGVNVIKTFFNPNTTVAIGSASFVASNDTSHSLVTSINYNKGNVNNGPINWSTTNLSPVSNVATLNGYTASFNLVKDKNVSIINYPQITGSRFGTFNNDYAFNFTSSLTASIEANATGSVTMSLEITEAGIITSSKVFSATSTGVSIITASFDTRNENPYNITASVIFNKGNISNTPINWLVTGSGKFIGVLESSSFNIKKDVNTTMVTASFTASISSSYLNDYAFNQTASISSSFIPYYTSGSASLYVAKANIIIPEASIDDILWISSSAELGMKTLTSSFAAQTINKYSVTGSIITYEIPAVDYLIVAGGGGSGARVRTDDNTGLPAEGSYIAGGGAGGLLSGSLILTSSRTYPITIGFGGLTAPGTGINTRSSNGGNSTVFDFTSIGGGYGGFIDAGDNRIPPTEVLGGNGGSGGGYGPSNGVAGQGNNGLGSGYLIGAGAGSSSGSVATWLDGNTYAGGGGGWRYPTYATFITASNNTGSFGGGGTAISNGQGGIATSGSAGVVKLRYSSSIALATGGEITSASGYIYHTFTSASLASTSGTGSFTFYGLVPV